MTTNTTVDVDPGDHVQLRITLTRSGATPSDQAPQGECEACPITVRIDNGGGELLLINDDQNESCVGFSSSASTPTTRPYWISGTRWAPAPRPPSVSPIQTCSSAHGTGVAATVTFIQRTPNVTGTISGVSYDCGEVGLCPSTWEGSFQLNISASINPDGSFLVDSATGQVDFSCHDHRPHHRGLRLDVLRSPDPPFSLVFPRTIPDSMHEWYVPAWPNCPSISASPT